LLQRTGGGDACYRQRVFVAAHALGILADLRKRSVGPGADLQVALASGFADTDREVDDDPAHRSRFDADPA
jgi:hypothetical protein